MDAHTAVIDQSEQFFSALLDTLLAYEDTFGTPFVGTSDWGSTDYPASELIPESASYQSPNEYQYACRVNLYYRRSRMTDYITDIIPTLSDVVETGADEIAATNLHAFRVAEIEYFVGEDFDSTSIVLISLRWTAEGPADLAKR